MAGLTVKVSAPGKVILHGEHSVVYGKLAIAASLDLRTDVVLQEKQNNRLEIYFSDLKLRKKYDLKDIKAVFKTHPFPVSSENFCYQSPEMLNHHEYIQILTQALKLDEHNLERNCYLSLLGFFYLYFGILHSSNIPIEAISITIKTELSLGAGTGSSASLMVSLAGALIRYLTHKVPTLKLKSTNDNSVEDSKVLENFNDPELSLISKWAFAAEKIIHGNPSGIDNTVCTYGSMVSFRKGRAPIAVKCRNDIRGLLVDTRVPKNTGAMVQKVLDLRKRRPKVIDSIFQCMEDVTDEALELLVHLGELQDSKEQEINKCYEDLGELSDLNHSLLRSLNVSHPDLENVIEMMNGMHLHGKLTGSGGGGYAISLIPPYADVNDISLLCHRLTEQGYKSIVTKLGGTGVKVD